MIRPLHTITDPQLMTDRVFILLLVAVVLLLRLGWILLIDTQPVSDFSWYFNHAVALSEGRGYVTDDGIPTAFFPIGYPAFLALIFVVFGPSVLLAKLANLVLATGTISIFYLFARALIKRTEVHRLAVLLVALFPSQIAYSSLISDSILFQFFLFLGLWSLMKTSLVRVLLGGIVFGLSILTRPYAFMIPLIAGLSLWTNLRLSVRFRNLLLVYLTSLIVVAPWTMRNYLVFENFIPVSTNGGINLLIGNGPGATGRYNEKALAALNGHHLDEYQRDQLARKLAIQHILDKPTRFLRLALAKVFYTYADDAQALRWNLKGIKGEGVEINYGSLELLAMGLFQAFYSLVILGCVLYLVLAHLAKRRAIGIHPVVFWVFLYFTLIAMVFFGNPRLHFPVIPMFCLYAGSGLLSVAKPLWERLFPVP